MLREARPDVPANIEVPETLSEPGAPPALVFTEKTVSPMRAGAPDATEMSAATILAGLAALAAAGARAPAGMGIPAAGTGATAPAAAGGAPADSAPAFDPALFPSLDPLMALGTSTPLFATLAHWQRLDLPTAIAQAAPRSETGDAGGNVVPLNLIPHIRAAIDGQISNDTDRITMDVIALLFDYIFRDRSIPDALRSLFGRLQVPIVKAALLDRTFFSDKRHSARQLLDNLADAAIGATHDENYRAAFTALAAEVVEDICRDFEIDVGGVPHGQRAARGVHRGRAAEGRDGDDRRRRGGADRRAERIGPLARARVPPRPPRRRRRAVRGARLRRDRVGRAHGAAARRPRARQRRSGTPPCARSTTCCGASSPRNARRRRRGSRR